MKNQPSMEDQFLTMINQIIEDHLDDEHFSVEDLAEKARQELLKMVPLKN